jgi:hypothetical protein
MANIVISNEGLRPMGPLGIKKAEIELIERRYKHQLYNNGHIEMPIPLPMQKYNGIARLASLYGNKEIQSQR